MPNLISHDSIFERLRKEGYGPVIDHFPRPDIVSRDEVYRTPELLTDYGKWFEHPEQDRFVSLSMLYTGWNVIGGRARDVMNHLKGFYLEQVFYKPRRDIVRDAWKAFLANYDQSPNTPSFVPRVIPRDTDILTHSDIRPIIEVAGPATQEELEPAISKFKLITDEWRMSLENKLRHIIQRAYNTNYLPDPQILGLATTMFKCRACTGVLFYPGILKHRCTYVQMDCEDPFPHELKTSPWMFSDRIVFEPSMMRTAHMMLVQLGINPDCMTFAALEQGKHTVNCLACIKENYDDARNIPWKEAVSTHPCFGLCFVRQRVSFADCPPNTVTL